MDVRSDQEPTHPVNNVSVTGFQEDQGHMIELIRARAEEDEEHTVRNVLRADIPGKGREDDRQQGGKTRTESGRGDGHGDVEKEDQQSYRRPYV